MTDRPHTSTDETPQAHDVPPGLQAATPADAVRAVGAELARLRTQRGWSVDDVSVRLKVGTAKLRALEAGDLTHLPDLTFAVGVVRSYAKALGVDPAPFADALRRATATSKQGLRLPAAHGADLPRAGHVRQMNLNGQRARRPWFWAVAAALLGLVALTMYHTERDPSGWLARFTAGERAGAPAAGTHGGAPAAASATAAVTPAPAASSVVAVPAQAASSAQAGSGVAAPVAGASATKAAAVAAATNASGAQAAQATVLRFAFTKDSWVGVRQADGKEIFSGTVHGGTPQDVQGVGPLKIVIGNRAGLATLQLDGKPVDPTRFGDVRGNVARFTLP